MRKIVLIAVVASCVVIAGCGKESSSSAVTKEDESPTSVTVEPSFQKVLDEAKTAKQAHVLWQLAKADSAEKQAAADHTAQLIVKELDSAKTAKDAHVLWELALPSSPEKQAATDRITQLVIMELRAAKTVEDIEKAEPFVMDVPRAKIELRIAKDKLAKK